MSDSVKGQAGDEVPAEHSQTGVHVSEDMISAGLDIYYSYSPGSDGGWMDYEMVKDMLEEALKRHQRQ